MNDQHLLGCPVRMTPGHFGARCMCHKLEYEQVHGRDGHDGLDQVLQLVSDQELDEAFANTNFGGADRRRLIAHGILAKGAGFATGGTLGSILKELKLVSPKSGKPTKKGMKYAMWWFYESKHSG